MVLKAGELATSIVDKFTDLHDLEDENHSALSSPLLRPMVKELKKLQLLFKPAFEQFQKLHNEIILRQRVAISRFNSIVTVSCP